MKDQQKDQQKDLQKQGAPNTPSGPYRDHSDEALGHALVQLHGVLNAVHRQILAITAEAARRSSFSSDGARDPAAWLCSRLGVSPRTGLRWAEVADALETLPETASAFESGEICFDKLAAAVKVATPETHSEIAAEAKQCSVTWLERAARRARAVSVEEEAAVRDNRRLSWSWHDQGTRLVLSASLDAEAGSRVVAALDRIAESLPVRDVNGDIVPGTARRADALEELASARVAEDQDPDMATVVVNTDLDTIRRGLGVGESEDGAIFSSDVMARMLCESRIQLLIEDGEGVPIGLGRTRRTVSRRLRRTLKKRDHVCRFPGCGATRFLRAHHIHWWTRGGPTDPENLILLCPHHHGLLHEGRWTLRGDPGGDVVWVRPDGSILHEGPPPLDYDVKKWLWEDVFGAPVGSALGAGDPNRTQGQAGNGVTPRSGDPPRPP